MTAFDTRTDRQARPAAPPLPPFETLDQTHRQILTMMAQLRQLLDHVDEQGADDDARRIAADQFEFFSSQARQHHEQEETLVFPSLLDSPNLTLVGHVRRLQEDHRWLEQDWREIGPHLEALARGYNWYDAALLREAVPIFAKLYEDHIALEEGVVYPAAKQQHAG